MKWVTELFETELTKSVWQTRIAGSNTRSGCRPNPMATHGLCSCFKAGGHARHHLCDSCSCSGLSLLAAVFLAPVSVPGRDPLWILFQGGVDSSMTRLPPPWFLLLILGRDASGKVRLLPQRFLAVATSRVTPSWPQLSGFDLATSRSLPPQPLLLLSLLCPWRLLGGLYLTSGLQSILHRAQLSRSASHP